MIRRHRKQRGFTLVELMIVVAIIGILAALAIYGVKRYITSTKTAEAKEMLGRIAKDASAAYQRESMAGTILEDGKATAAVHALCESVEEENYQPPEVPKGEKGQPDAKKWTEDAGWNCLKFSFSEPVYYQYSYEADETNFQAVAQGNLDAEEVANEFFALKGVVREGAVVIAPTTIEADTRPGLTEDAPEGQGDT